MRVLIVVREQRLLDALVAAFRLRWPDVVLVTSSGVETDIWPALEHACDAVVLDADLSQRSGFDLLADIRRTSDVPVVLLTAGERSVDRESSRALGANLHLHKPFSTRMLLDFVGQTVAARRPRPRGRADLARIAIFPALVSAAVLLAAAVGPLTSMTDFGLPYQGLRQFVVCDLPPDLVTDQFEALGWCERDG